MKLIVLCVIATLLIFVWELWKLYSIKAPVAPLIDDMKKFDEKVRNGNF